MNQFIINKIKEIAIGQRLPLLLCTFIACQSAFETFDFTSKNFLLNNNGFGYKFVKGAKLQLQKAGIKSTESDNYANYATIEDSVKEICNWIKRRQREKKFPQDLNEIKNESDYAILLKKCGYYGGNSIDYASGMLNYKIKYQLNK